ncbi:MAG TPA: cytochrome c biogenesis protein CcsA [Planctomycetaceae bacterium]|nr:cytochrome c biogenesis protein CcsA [Planctomycetaceae bacterium]
MIRTAVCFLLLALGALTLTAANAADPPANVPSASAAASTRLAHPNFDWSGWQRIPVFSDGRLKPLDSLADEVVNVVTGRSKWTDPEAEEAESKDPHTFLAPELLYGWITRPDDWIDRPIFRCEYRPLREKLNTDKIKIPVTGTFISLGQILDWKQSEETGRPVYWSKDLEERLIALDRARGKSPDSVGDTAEDRAINGKVAELFHHVKTFLDLRHGNDIYVVPGLDPRALTRQTDPDERINAWISLGSLLEADKWRGGDDVSLAAIMAEDRDDLARTLLDPRRAERYSSSDPNHPKNLVTMLPQLCQAQNAKGDLQIEIRNLKKALEETRTAYDANNKSAFDSSMHAFVEQLRRLAKAIEAARAQMVPPQANAFKFGLDEKLNGIIWERYEPLPLFEPQMQFSAYPPPGALETEILYNKYQPFRSAWIVFLVALCLVVAAGMLKSSRFVFASGLAVTLAAIVYAAWGFSLRIAIAGRPPVTNMYETVIWASFVVSVLGFWFCVLPVTWPGLSWAWRLSGLPVRRRPNETGFPPYLEFDRPKPEDAGKIASGALVPVQCLASVLRLAAFAATVWFLTRSDTSFRIIKLTPPIFGKAVAMSSVGTWLVGMATVCTLAWFGSRAVITLLLTPITLVPEAARGKGEIWSHTLQRRYFLLGALPVVCFGMMLAHFVGMTSPDIFNPRVGSITAVLRNNYWLAIHVLTIVSSYGAGGLAWGLGNLAMLYYLFGKYRAPGQSASLADATPGAGGPPHNGGPIFDLDAHYRGAEPSLAARLKKAGEALNPGMLPRTLKAGFEDFGTGDQHLALASTRPPKEVATLASYTYKAQQVAVLLLAAGTILGGLWADVSWGRFWDWDPKEVWALVSLLAYLVVLHGRYAGWFGTFATNVGGVLCFSAILFSWYGVNFVLPMVYGWLNGTNMPTEVGLHAYAVGSGGLAYVSTAVVLNLLLVVAAWGRYAAETTDLLSRTTAAKSETQPAAASTSAG